MTFTKSFLGCFEDPGLLESNCTWTSGAITQGYINFRLQSGPGRSIHDFSMSIHKCSFSESNKFTLFNTLNIRESSKPLTRGRYVPSSASRRFYILYSFLCCCTCFYIFQIWLPLLLLFYSLIVYISIFVYILQYVSISHCVFM